MGVPDTNTFTLQNVVDVIDNDDNLVGCFNDAVASKFDSNYSGSKNNLLNFRNYDASVESFPQIYKRQNSTNIAGPFTFYYSAGSFPVTLYTDANLTTLVGQWNGVGQSWKQDITGLTASQRVCGSISYDGTFQTDSSSNMGTAYCGQ